MFFGNPARSRAGRRGVVLILVLGMLALMALIGVTFATFAGQSLVSNRNFAQGVTFPTSEQVMDYALAQLINDTNNPTSALRGHSLTRDIYGNNSLMTGNTASFRGVLSALPAGGPLLLTAGQAYNFQTAQKPFNLAGSIQYQTNIPVYSLTPALYNADFTRWILRIPANYGAVASTYVILEDDMSTQYHIFTLAATDPHDIQAVNPVTRMYRGADNPYIFNASNQNPPTKLPTVLNTTAPLFFQTPQPIAFTLDGRYMHAFDGSGMTRHNPVSLPSNIAGMPNAGVPNNNAAYANFRTNRSLLLASINPNDPSINFSVPSFGDPNFFGMDEDYDACDLENWFLALQSADGQVMIPSFHRPGILTLRDWQTVYTGQGTASDALAVMSMSKILRPRQIDNSLLFPIDPIPDSTGKIKYDIDNDGDGVTDSVWLDLGFPSKTDARGLIFKPLFAFMVIGLNGRLPLNTVGNLQGRDFQTKTATTTAAPFNYEYGPQTLLDGSTWSHTSHLGFSVNEINPLFALQNASNIAFGNNIANNPTFTQHDNSTVALNVGGTAYTSPGAMVDVVQLRNLLAGTVPQDNLTSPTGGINNDANWVLVNNQRWYMPNSMVDNADTGSNGLVSRLNDPVMGRWGERNGIPKVLSIAPSSYQTQQSQASTITSLVYNNPVRAGRSGVSINGNWSSSDATDDDYDSFDFFPFHVSGVNDPVPANMPISTGEGFYLPGTLGNPGTGAGDYYDDAGAIQLPVERIRRFTTPIDPAGVGRVVAWNQRPVNAYDYGLGFDKHGRTGYFRYFRPAGVPKGIAYDPNALAPDVYNQPIAVGPATAANTGGEWIFDTTNNRLHGFTSQLNPLSGPGGAGGLNSMSPEAGVAVMAAMPWDWTNGMAAFTFAQSSTLPPYPRIVLSGTGDASHADNSGTMSTSINSGQGPLLPYNDPNYTLMPNATVVNSYPTYPLSGPGSSLNKDEADEMNLYTPNLHDSPFGPSDLEWLYRTQDVDGASLDSRLKHLAPISFLNPADGSTRRRLFSTDSWELISPSFANDQPPQLNYLQPVPGVNNTFFTQDQDFTWNSRFNTGANASLVGINYNLNPSVNNYPYAQNYLALTQFANPVSFPQPIPTVFPFTMTAGTNSQLPPVVTPSVAHRDRKINLNYPLPISNDPAEPVRQKWVREAYEYFKAILPPQAIDTPQELAQLSQFVVNIVDFRDPDCSTTRFVNTDLMVLAANGANPASVVFSNLAVPTVATTLAPAGHFAYDPTILDEQTYPTINRDATWQSHTSTNSPAALGDFLVQHGMEYNPIALNEVLATTYPLKSNTGTSQPFTRFAVEVVNTLTDDNIVPITATGSSDLDAKALDGWDFVVTLDKNNGAVATGRPDPITGDIPPLVLIDATSGNRQAVITSGTPAPSTPQFTFTNIVYAMRHNGPVGGRTGQNNTNGYFQFGSPNPTGIVINATTNVETAIFPTNDANFPSTFGLPIPTSGTTQWFWVYLRRPANPFDTRPHAQREMVVVDSMRFPFANGGATGTVVRGPGGVDTPNNDTATQGTQSLFSVSRLQPYRGGHHVPKLTATSLDPSPPWAWGYSEQSAVQTTVMTAHFGDQNAAASTIARVTHSINAANSVQDATWDYIPFHDRDFMSPAELLLVPGCSPGLFTKQFVYENDPTLVRYESVNDGSLTTPPAQPPPTGPSSPPYFVSTGFDPKTPRTYPYLNDEFFYTGASVAPNTLPPTTAIPYPTKIGGITGDGWHKILEFVEVPSSANGSIGTVSAGSNFDWYRQDVKPGLINLNLIIDEEVFFGVFDDPRLNKNFASQVSILPYIVTQIDANGYPAFPTNPLTPNALGAYQIPDRGYAIVDPLSGFEQGWVNLNNNVTVTGMKAAFSDFLKLRSGGSGYLFAWGSGMVGSGPYGPTTALPALIQSPVARERPFRSLSYPDINDTIMRPATLPPSPLTLPVPTMGPPYRYNDDQGNSFQDQTNTNTAIVLTPPFVGDPGVRNPFLSFPANNRRLLPLIPLRRLFQIPDAANGLVNNSGKPSGSAEYPLVAGVPTPPYNVNQPITHPQLSDNSRAVYPIVPATNTIPSSNVQTANLFLDFQVVTPPGAVTNAATVAQVNQYLGANIAPGVAALSPQNPTDSRQHPYYRTEMLQKVMNLTTVRTHQFAVWITVGFFEVLKTGSPALGVPDTLGGELGLFAGKNIRYRSFFLIDRTRAVGFNPHSPQDFRDMITYRRRIE